MSLTYLEMKALAEEKQALEQAKKEAFFAQPGYTWNVMINLNAAYNDRTGHLGQVSGIKAVNGAPDVDAAYGKLCKAWVFGAQSLLDQYGTSLKLAYFVSLEDFESEENSPFVEVDAIVSRQGKGGKVFIDNSGEEHFLTKMDQRNVDPTWKPMQELVFKAYLEMGGMTETTRPWDPQANNPLKGLAGDSLAAKLENNSAQFVTNQAIGLSGWRANRAANLGSNSIASQLVDASTNENATPSPAKASRKSRTGAV